MKSALFANLYFIFFSIAITGMEREITKIDFSIFSLFKTQFRGWDGNGAERSKLKGGTKK
jgi:hypothetical protein